MVASSSSQAKGRSLFWWIIWSAFLGGPLRDDLFPLGVLGIDQYLPFFAKRYFESKPEGFIRNN